MSPPCRLVSVRGEGQMRCWALLYGPQEALGGGVSYRVPGGCSGRKGEAVLFSSRPGACPQRGGAPTARPSREGRSKGGAPLSLALASSLLTGQSSCVLGEQAEPGWAGLEGLPPRVARPWASPAGQRRTDSLCLHPSRLPTPTSTHPGDTGIHSPAGPGPLHPCLHPRG